MTLTYMQLFAVLQVALDNDKKTFRNSVTVNTD